MVEGDCIEWPHGRSGNGYGVAYVDGRQVPAHKLAYEEQHGPVPDGLVVCHHCDNPPCVNPAHLFAGTQGDNLRDMAQKGRHGRRTRPERTARGARHGRAKLTEQSVRQIRTLLRENCSQTEIARRFGVTKYAIYDIAHRRSWAHVEED